MIELLAALVHPLTLVLLFGGAIALDYWLIDRRRRRPSPPPDTP